MPDLRGAILGYGLAGRVFHGPLIDATPGLEVAVVATSNPERARQAQEAHPGAEVVADAEAALARSDELDFAVVANANEAHVPSAMAALEAGLPAVVDKPLAATAVEARELADEAERRGVLLTVFFNRRWDSDQLTLARLLDEGTLGRILRHESRFERWRPELKEEPAWREVQPPERGGGLLLDLGAHLVDQALVLFGRPESVYAEIDSRRGGAADDDVFVALSHPDRVRTHIWCSALAREPGPRRRVLGDAGSWVAEELDGQEEALKRGEPPERGGWLVFYERWERALRGDGPPPVDPRDAVAGLEILDAARRSAETGEVVSLR